MHAAVLYVSSWGSKQSARLLLFFSFFFLRVDGILFCGGVVVNLFAGAHTESAEFQTTTASYKLRINWT